MTTDPSSASPVAVMRDVSAALRRGDLDAADRVISAGKPAHSALLSAAELAMTERSWGHAAWLFDRVPHDGGTVGIKRCLCRNLASLQRHRPALYELFVTLPKSDSVGVGTSATGQPTIVCRAANGKNVALSPGNLPLSGLSAALHHLRPVIDAGTCFALCGIGDGYLLHQLAEIQPKLYMNMQLSIFVLECNAHVALTAMMIHDYSGPAGPIEQARFQWFVGPRWEQQLRDTVLTEPTLPCPHISISLGLDCDAIQKALNAVINELGAQDQRYAEAIEVYYASISTGEFSEMFADHPRRKPRVMFMTTRFSTVLQFATNDVADAFREAGWDAKVLIEPTSYRRMMRTAIRQCVAEFKPDLVFQIDHQRSEHSDLFPKRLPFVCWIQDHMEQLATRGAGAKIGVYDFVLTDAGPLYAHNYNYPARQLIPVAKLTTPPALLPAPKQRGEDMVFVSNATATREALRANLLRKLEWGQSELDFVGRCVDRIFDIYTAGETIPTYRDVYEYLKQMLVEDSLSLPEEQFLALAREISHPICDTLYRHQALAWAVEAAGKLGLSLGLYGNSWEKNPQFAAFARGPIAPGRELQELVRRSAINFQIAPYFCLHQRLLDGICCGGFFLVREHLTDTAPQAMLNLLEGYCPPGIGRLNDARATIPPPVRDRFERLARECRRTLCSNGTEDPIEMVRAWQEAQLLVSGKGVLPRLDEVSFSSAESLRQRIKRFVANPDLRDAIVAEQRQSIAARLTYSATMRRVVRTIGQLLPAEDSNSFSGISINLDIGKAA